MMVAVSIAAVSYWLTEVSDWSPGGSARDSGGQGLVVAMTVMLLVAVPWFLWIWSRPMEDSDARQTSRLLQDINTERRRPDDHDRP